MGVIQNIVYIVCTTCSRCRERERVSSALACTFCLYLQSHLQYKDDEGHEVNQDTETDDSNVAKFTVEIDGLVKHIVHDYDKVRIK